MFYNVSPNAEAILQNNFLIGESSCNVVDGSMFSTPSNNDSEILTLYNSRFRPSKLEVVRLTARVSNTLTIAERGLDGTTEQDWLAGEFIGGYIPKSLLNKFQQKVDINYEHVNIPTASFNLIPTADDVIAYAIRPDYVFFIDKFATIITGSTGVTVNPSISIGTSPGGTQLLASTQLTSVGLNGRNVHTPLILNGLSGSIYISVKVGATAALLTAVVLMSGIMKKV